MKNIITILLCVLSLSLFAQEKGIIKGTIQDEKGAVEFASLVLRSATDSSIVKTALSEEGGVFEFVSVSYASYFIETLHLGYDDFTSEVFEFNQAEMNMPDITLKTNAVELATAEVVSRKPFIERKIDRTVLNIEGTALSLGDNALDILNSAPGVTVNIDGSVSITGKDGVLIYVDGRPTYLNGSDLTAYLENLSAEELAQIEIMKNPPASYDASGNAGIINIKSRKSALVGYRGSTTAFYKQGRYPSYGISSNLSYRNRNVNIFGTLSASDNETFTDSYTRRNIRDQDTDEILATVKKNNAYINNSKSLNASLGTDFFLNERSTIGVVAKFSGNFGDGTTASTTRIFDPSGTIAQSIDGRFVEEHDWNNFSANANYALSFNDTTDHSIYFDFGYVHYTDNENHSFTNDFYDGDIIESPLMTQISSSAFPENYNIYSARADYELPFDDEKGTLELGVKASYVDLKIVSDFFDQNADGTWVKDASLSNDFRYKEHLNAAYTSLSYDFSDKFSAGAGLRMEHINSTGRQIIRNESFDRNNVQFFPTLYLQYVLGEGEEIGLSYGRRIDRPDYEDLNPFREYIDEFTFEEGNKNLRPQITNNLELSWVTMDDMAEFTAFYNHRSDLIMETVTQDNNNNFIITRPENLGTNTFYGVSGEVELEPTDFWITTFYAFYYRRNTTGMINDQPFELGRNTLSGAFINSFYFDKGWSIVSAFWHVSKKASETFVRDANPRFSFFVQKKFWDNQANLKLVVNDVFNLDQYTGTSRYQNVDVFQDIKEQTQYMRLSFTYKFKGGKLKERRGRGQSATEDELNRFNK